VNPDTVKAQIEGGIIFGIGAPSGRGDAGEGPDQQSNFHDVRVLRINEAPAIAVHLVRNLEAPADRGAGTAVTAPAVANAVFARRGSEFASCRWRSSFVRLEEAPCASSRCSSSSFLSRLQPRRSRGATPPETGLFEPIASVVMHPRCINCHQDESPRQTDEKIVHRPFVVRGKDDHGAPTQPCQTCHQATNTADGFVPA